MAARGVEILKSINSRPAHSHPKILLEAIQRILIPTDAIEPLSAQLGPLTFQEADRCVGGDPFIDAELDVTPRTNFTQLGA